MAIRCSEAVEMLYREWTSEILETVPRDRWNHISSKENPADIASRGVTPKQLLDCPLWWTGPPWLVNPTNKWPTQKKSQHTTLEERAVVLRINTESPHNHTLEELFTRVASYSKIKRILARILKFSVMNRHLDNVELLKKAEKLCVKWAQSKEFQNEINSLKQTKKIGTKSKIISLYPFVDEEGLLRVGGMGNLNAPYDVKHPMLLPKKHLVTDRIVKETHIRYLHPGPTLQTSILRQKYWILNCRNAVRSQINSCVECRRQRAATAQQLMGNLPASRITPSRPFLHTGVDYAGPLSLKSRVGRGRIPIMKGYICLFVCFATKAIHIELCHDMTAEAFIAALRRFISRRGIPTEIISDNGTNFVGAARLLGELHALLKSPAHEARWTQIQKEIESTGSYQLTETELIYGAKLAWRNSSRCIGRIQWSKLQLFDCRYVTTTSGMFEAICNHIKYATNKGNLRSAITIFPQRTDGRHDYRIWNPQLISYAGYRNNDGTIIGDPMNVEITDVCVKLGWKGKLTEWDILPLVLSANGHDPDYFDYPPDLIVEIPLEHPSYKWFADLKLRWYALPAVSNMLFDCGGIQFTATAFSGWYMATEIGCRNLGDTNRRNLIEPVALKMGLDTRTTTSLWKDKALVEMNIAVLYSFQSKNITIVDHHTASESFMKHFENETKLRNGCPADWIWIVPPMSSSLTPVFHQEMALYFLKPSFEYQEQAWKTHVWKKGRDSAKTKKPRRKFHFKQIARAVKFTSKLFGRALSRRIKATVLYATETGKSEQYAKQLGELLSHAFNAQVYCMSDYDISSIEHEALLFVVASTFGNGDPPENGESFAQDLYAMKLQENGDVFNNKILSVAASSKSFIKANSRSDMVRGAGAIQNFKKIDRLDSMRGSTSDNTVEETFGPLSNVRFAIFALGSSAYPNFCAFGKYIDNILGELGGERITRLAIGDEMCGQEQEFRKWAPEVFKLACETFCLDNDDTFSDASFALENDSLTVNTIRFTSIKSNQTLAQSLEKYHNKKIVMCKLKRRPINLSTELNATERSTILVEILSNEIEYEPGDHVGIIPMNRKQIVDGLLSKLVGVDDPDEIIQLQMLKEYHTSNGISKAWEPHERIPACSLRVLLSQFLDITTPPSRKLLTLLATFCDDKQDIDRLTILANESSAYEDWRHWRLPHLLEVLDEFPSCKPPASLIVASLMPLQPRFYSISSSQLMYRHEMHLTVGIVKYRTEDDEGSEHYGVCSNYLEGLNENDSIYLFVRNAPLFHVPEDSTRPIIMIGPGTGIAPFRGFWQHWHMKKRDYGEPIPKAWLLFGCRKICLDLYREEKNEMSDMKVLDRVFLALSREKNIPKTYVQDLAIKESDSIYDLIVKENGHIYVCGDVTMAEHVYQTLRKIIAEKEQKPDFEIEKFMMNLRDENRYHEDIFGITLRTAEIHNKSRASARIRMASQP